MELALCTCFSLYIPKLFNCQTPNQFPTNSIICGVEKNGGVKSSVVSAREKRAGSEVETLVIEKPKKVKCFEVFEGYPTPLGATAMDGGVNFAIFSGNSVSATLCLFSVSDLQEDRVTEQISLDPLTNKTGNVWHVFLKGNFNDMLYGYKFDGPFSPEEGHYYDSSHILLDPYARAVIHRGELGVVGPDGDRWAPMACMIPSPIVKFDWEGDPPLTYPQRDLIIYEMHVREFTRHESSKVRYLGTYLGVVEKLDRLKILGNRNACGWLSL